MYRSVIAIVRHAEPKRDDADVGGKADRHARERRSHSLAHYSPDGSKCGHYSKKQQAVEQTFQIAVVCSVEERSTGDRPHEYARRFVQQRAPYRRYYGNDVHNIDDKEKWNYCRKIP